MGFKYAHSMGEELMSVGINLDFAPCVDVLTNPKNPVIGDRSIHSDPEEVAKIASLARIRMDQNQKYKQYLLLIPIFLFLCVIITSEKNLYRLNDSDLNFDLF